MTSSFRHQETERTIAFGRGAIDSSLDLFGDGFTLLTTEQASKAAPAVTALANEVITVPPGLVEEIAEALRPLPVDRGLVALGGGRVIDVAKALAAADRLSGLVAIPTTLSGAEMTGRHRQIAGIPANTPYVRPTVVINDPSLSASQAVPDLAASSANALGHAITAVLSDRSTPFARAVGSEALRSLCTGWSGSEPDRDSLALGALLAGWAVDKSGLGLHHAMAQTAVRAASIGHAEANAALLPATISAIRRRRPKELSDIDQLLGEQLEVLAQGLAVQAGGAGLGAIGTDAALRDQAIETVLSRTEIGFIAPAPDRAELAEIYISAAG